MNPVKTNSTSNTPRSKQLPAVWKSPTNPNYSPNLVGRWRRLWSNLCGDSLVYGRSGGLAAFVGATLLAALLATGVEAAETVMLNGLEVRTDSVVVKWKDAAKGAQRSLSTATKDAVLSKVDGATAIEEFTELPGLAVVELTPAPTARRTALSKEEEVLASVQQLKKQIAELEATGLFEYVEPDYIVGIQRSPTETSFTDGSLWGLRNTGQKGATAENYRFDRRYDPATGTANADIRATSAWDVTTGSTNVVVAVIDTGVRYTHQDLAANMWRNPGEIAGNGRDDDNNGYIDDVHGINGAVPRDRNGNLPPAAGDPMDDNGHGTHCAGTIGAVANGGGPAVGVAWNVRLMALKFLESDGNGSISAALACINYAVAKGAHIMSNSWGTRPGGAQPAGLRDAVAAANARGVLFVVAAGNNSNNNDTRDVWPTNVDLPNVLSVAATDRQDGLASFSNYGRQKVHLGAPGVAIFSCWAGSDTDYNSIPGTSMACPHVAGAAALVKARFPSADAAEMKQRILSTVDPVNSLTGKTVTGGRLNVDRAVRSTADGIMDLRATPAELPLPGGGNVVMRVQVTDLNPVLNASVTARFGSNAPVTLRDNGLAPDETANDGTYSVNMAVPGTGTSVRLTVNASASGKQPAQATFDFPVLQRLANDNFANRAELAPGSVRTTGSNSNSSRENGEPRNPSVAGDSTVWWSWRAPASASATITTAGSNFDTTLAIYRGDSLAQLTLMGANDDSAGLTSAVTFQAQQGVVYAIQVSGYGSRSGDIVLNYPAPGGANAPVIVEEPAAVSVLEGSPFNIRVVATGATAYQWYRNNQPITGATNQEYNVERSTLADDGIYRVVASNSSGSTSSREVRVTVNRVQANPDNDAFAQRLLLTGFSGRTSSSNANATGETNEPNHAGVSTPLNSMWFAWQAPAAGELVLDTVGSDFDTTLAVYRGTAVNALTAIVSNDDAEGRQSRVQFPVTAGTTYMIAVDGYSSRTGSIVLNHAFTPSSGGGANNDNFANRIAVVPNLDYAGSNSSATGESGEPNHHGVSAPLNSLWWQWTATGNGVVEIVTTGSNFDTTLAAYTGNAVNALTSVASNDDYNGLQSRVQFQARAGERYLIAVDGYSSARGNVRLRLNFTSSADFNIRPDFNNDGRTDLLWHNSVDGRVVAWLRLEGSLQSAYLGQESGAWAIVATGDFNGDSQADLLWRNSTTGAVRVWTMNGVRRTQIGNLQAVHPVWQIAASGDFNRDGRTDILWRNSSTGLLQVWMMNGAARQSVQNIGVMSDNDWQIVGTGNFDFGGASDDIVWHNRRTGILTVWFMDGTRRVSGASLGGVADTNWQAETVADFNGDSFSDVVWRNRTTGLVVAWHQNGRFRTGSSILGGISRPEWQLRNR
jgi:subtilisin family serine protease